MAKEFLVWFEGDGFQNAELVAADSPQDAADWLYDSDPSLFDLHPDTQTYWLKAYVVPVDNPEADPDTVKVAVHPEEPKCPESADGLHEWDDDGAVVRGSGGGVRVHTTCLLCGLERVEDTWAQDPIDGEQGLDSIEYVDRDPYLYDEEYDF